MMSDIYNNAFSPTNVYGRTMPLLRDYARRGEGLVHLDIGCGFGAIAPFVRDMGLTYVGVDLDHEGVGALQRAGYEAHVLELADEAATFDRLSAVLAGRALASVTILDTLEHVPSPLDVMRAIRRLIGEDQVPMILSVPNVTHLENVAKMVAGRFEYTVDGLLDRTHIINFSHETLARMTRQAGLVEIARNDTIARFPDRDLQLDPDALGHESSWFRLVGQLREMARDDALSYQFVRAYLPGPARDENWFVDPSARGKRPFLSIIMRTTGRETYALKDVLNCLSGQSDQDFEVLLVGHKLDVPRQIEVEKVLEALPPYLAEKIQFLRVEDGNRTRPLNFGYARANGHYIVTLDDDDLIFGHYVETFRSIATQTPGRLLRARCASQTARKSQVEGGVDAAISTGPIVPQYPAFFNFVDHLHDNFTPCMSVAYPREAFHTFGLRFDETLATAEDYDFMMRAYFIFGIGCSDQITCVYRRWQGRVNSAVEHRPEEWQSNHARIKAKHDAMPVLLPPGALAEIRTRTGHQPMPSTEVAVAAGVAARVKRPLGVRIAREWGRFKRRRLGLK
jgi:2-polyprenyl-3-methyl-5-hydroxy-6-metoxy-1,4-benzoquinol methylase